MVRPLSSLCGANTIRLSLFFVDRTKDIGPITKEQAISYDLSGPNLRACGVDHDLPKRQPYLDYEQYDFDVPIGSVGDSHDHYLMRMEEIRQSVRILRQVCDTMPGGAWHVNDAKNYPPPKTTVLTKMEEFIHHVIIHTEGLKAPEGEVYYRRGKSEGRTRLLHLFQGRCHAVPPEVPQPQLHQSQHPAEAPSRSPDERCRAHPRLARLRDERVRSVARIEDSPLGPCRRCAFP